MLIYWILFFSIAYFALSRTSAVWSFQLSIFLVLIFSVFIGLRHEVGGDWFPYIRYLNESIDVPLSELSLIRDPSYSLVGWLSVQLSAGIYGLNFVCALLFSSSLVYFCSLQKRPWLALFAAVPCLIIVVALGYTRQAVSIGFLLLAYYYLAQSRTLWALFWIFMATSFQQTAVISLLFLLPAISASSFSIRLIKILLASFILYYLYSLFLAPRLPIFLAGYIIDAQMQSDGALFRLLMNVIPATLFLSNYKKLSLSSAELRTWVSLSLYSLFCFISFFWIPSSTVIDRLALYAIPLQLYVASILPDLLPVSIRKTKIAIPFLAFYLFSIQFIWLVFGNFSSNWIPYQNLLFGFQ